jgi:hypothetical protein
MAMPSRRRVLSLLGETTDYQTVSAHLHVPPGLAMMIATGLPADGSDDLTPQEYDRPGLPAGTTQYLTGTAAHNPTRDDKVLEWIQDRARRDAQMQVAAAAERAEQARKKPRR